MPNERPKLKLDRSPIHSAEGRRHKIAWMREFREMLREHPGVIKVAIGLMDRAIAEYNPLNFQYGNIELKYDLETARWMEETEGWPDETGKTRKHWEPMPFGRGTILVPGQPITDEEFGLKVVVLGRSNRKKGEGPFGIKIVLDRGDYFKISIRNKTFFVKRNTISTNPGVKEFKATLRAREALRDLEFVRVIEPQLGYQDKKQSWYISRWEEIEGAGLMNIDTMEFREMDDYGQSIKNTRGFDEKARRDLRISIDQQLQIIKDRLRQIGITDIDANLFYDPKTRTYILLDVTDKNKDNTIGSPRAGTAHR